MKQHFSIGQTARINGVPVKTLRYYDEIGLLHPSYVHPETGYRYYTQEQFYLIDIIKFAKRLGLSLEDTKALMVPGSLENMIELLELQQQRAEHSCKTSWPCGAPSTAIWRTCGGCRPMPIPGCPTCASGRPGMWF